MRLDWSGWTYNDQAALGAAGSEKQTRASSETALPTDHPRSEEKLIILDDRVVDVPKPQAADIATLSVNPGASGRTGDDTVEELKFLLDH